MKKYLIKIICIVALTACGGGGDNAPTSRTVDIVRTPAQLRWSDADAYCKNTAILGRTGWRLPTQSELSEYAKGGSDIGGGGAWSSTPVQASSHYYVSLNSTTGSAIAADDASFLVVRCAHD